MTDSFADASLDAPTSASTDTSLGTPIDAPVGTRTASFVVGAYAASPAHARWDPEAERAFFAALERIRLQPEATGRPSPDGRAAGDHQAVRAFELPWLGTLHPHDDAWLAANLPASVTAVMTDIGHVMSQIGGAGPAADGAEYGLASRSADARRAAISSALRLRDDVARLNDAAGRRVVTAIELHSAPRAHHGGIDPLAASLDELCAVDWDGADLLIEHCDAEIAGQTPEKGFLALEDEIAALRSCAAPVGLSLNWGRSAIELRDPDRVADQVAEASAAGLLRGIVFSGASDREGAAGYPWIDAHHAFAASDRHPFGDPTSLLTERRVAAALGAARDARRAAPTADTAPTDKAERPGDCGEPWLGVKVGWARAGGTVEERAQMVADALHGVQRARSAAQTA